MSYYDDGRVTLHHGDARDIARELAPRSVSCIVTSPPYYGLRDYGAADQIGLESTVHEYTDALVGLFRELKPALADDGTVWLNLGDAYAGRANNGPTYTGNHQSYKKEGRVPGRRSTTATARTKNLLGIPWRVAFALQDDGWFLRADIIWAKPNPMPESVTDRPTRSHEFIFLLTKKARYYYDAAAIAEADGGRSSGTGFSRPERISLGGDGRSDEWLPGAGRNRRDVWTVPASPFPGAHFAVYPPELIRPCIRAGARPDGIVLDPFSGSGTTGMVALQEGRRYIGIDTNREYLDLSLRTRFRQQPLEGVS